MTLRRFNLFAAAVIFPLMTYSVLNAWWYPHQTGPKLVAGVFSLAFAVNVALVPGKQNTTEKVEV